MEILDEKIQKTELVNFYIMQDPQFRILSHELAENYQLLVEMLEGYDEKLNKLLVLSRRAELKHFFREHHEKMQMFLSIFNNVTNEKIRSHILTRINKQIKYNLHIAKDLLTSKD